MLRRAATPPPAPVPTAPASRGTEPSPARAPHNMGLSGPYKFQPAAPPPPRSALAPLPSIEQEFLSRIAAKHAQGTEVRATRADRIADFDPDKASDSEVVVLGGGVPADTGGHNRDQGGKPADKKDK
ncbi:MAG: hypothetical protein ABIJ96_05015 [Elusimicrobiota bacterium]